MIRLRSRSVRNDPYPSYAEIRAAGRAVSGQNGAVWYVGRYSDALDVLRDPENFSSKFDGFATTLMRQDGAAHSRVRKRLLAAFSSTRINGLRAPVAEIANKLAKSASEETSFDFVEKFAAEIPATVVAWMLGVDGDRISDFRRWSSSIMFARTAQQNQKRHSRLHQFATRYLRPDTRRKLRAFDDIAECEAYLRENFANGPTKPQDSWVSELLSGQNGDDPLNPDELVELGITLVIAGIETTTNLTASAVLILAQNHHLQDHLRSRPEDLAPFIEEVLRFDSPVQRIHRVTKRETMIGGVDIAPGAKVEVLIGSANRDPDQFNEPDIFRIDRDPNQHIAFGAGPHFCLGAQLARLEAHAVLSAILETLPHFALADQTIRYPKPLTVRGPLNLKLELRQKS